MQIKGSTTKPPGRHFHFVFGFQAWAIGKGLVVGCFQLHISAFASLKDRILEWKEMLDILESKAFTIQVSKNQAPRGPSLCKVSLSQPMLPHSMHLLLRFPFSPVHGCFPSPLSPGCTITSAGAPHTPGAGQVSKVPSIHSLECWESDYMCHSRFLVQFFLYWSLLLQDMLWPQCLVQRFSQQTFLLVHRTP